MTLIMAPTWGLFAHLFTFLTVFLQPVSELQDCRYARDVREGTTCWLQGQTKFLISQGLIGLTKGRQWLWQRRNRFHTPQRSSALSSEIPKKIRANQSWNIPSLKNTTTVNSSIMYVLEGAKLIILPFILLGICSNNLLLVPETAIASLGQHVGEVKSAAWHYS